MKTQAVESGLAVLARIIRTMQFDRNDRDALLMLQGSLLQERGYNDKRRSFVEKINLTSGCGAGCTCKGGDHGKKA